MADIALRLDAIREVLAHAAGITAAHRTLSWEHALAHERARDQFGEANSDQALRDIPEGELVRLVLLTDQHGREALRWVVAGSRLAMEVLGGDRFDDLERGDSQGPVFWGEMERTGDQAYVASRIP